MLFSFCSHSKPRGAVNTSACHLPLLPLAPSISLAGCRTTLGVSFYFLHPPAHLTSQNSPPHLTSSHLPHPVAHNNQPHITPHHFTSPKHTHTLPHLASLRPTPPKLPRPAHSIKKTFLNFITGVDVLLCFLELLSQVGNVPVHVGA